MGDLPSVNWAQLSKVPMTESFLRPLTDVVSWKLVFQYSTLSEPFIQNDVSTDDEWHLISKHQKLSEHFMAKCRDQFDWLLLCRHQKMSNEYIE